MRLAVLACRPRRPTSSKKWWTSRSRISRVTRERSPLDTMPWARPAARSRPSAAVHPGQERFLSSA